jgi:hypothetical protein
VATSLCAEVSNDIKPAMRLGNRILCWPPIASSVWLIAQDISGKLATIAGSIIANALAKRNITGIDLNEQLYFDGRAGLANLNRSISGVSA